MVRITGGGTFTMKNVTVHTDHLAQFREDYGGFWHGDIVIENVTIKGYSSAKLFMNTWYNHDFGYPTALPTTITIDGLKMVDSSGNPYQNANVSLFDTNFINQTNDIVKDTYDTPVHNKLTNVNKMTPPAKVIIKNNTQGINFNLPNPVTYPFFANMQVIRDDE